MDRSVIRNAGLSLVLCAGLGMGAVAMTAQSAFAAENTDKAAATETATTDEKGEATDAKADEKATTDTKADDKAATTDTKAAAYTDGTYTASSKGIGGDVPVTVTIKDGKISDVTVGDNSETQGIGSKAIEQLPAKIVEANGTDGVDAVSGASVTSKAIFTAVNDCLEQASAGEAAAADTAAATDAAYTDGEYTASSKGIGGDVPVTVTVKDGKISKVEVGENSETEGIGSKAIEQLPDQIVEANGTEGVDALSGASVTSKAIFTAVDDCVEQAKEAAAKTTDTKADDKDAKADTAEAGAYADGEYTAEGKGIGGKVPVTVTIKDGKISDVTVGDNSETQGIGSKAIEQLPSAIVEANGTEGVDAVSGASVTSKAIFTAVEDCLEQAQA